MSNNLCFESFKMLEKINITFNQIDLELKTGSKCLSYQQFCDKNKKSKIIKNDKLFEKYQKNYLNLKTNILLLIFCFLIFLIAFIIYKIK